MHLEFKAGMGAVMATLCSLSMTAFAEPLHIEPGLWEVAYSYSLQGQPPPSVLAKMTPERRAEMEKKWAERKGQTKTNTSRTCVTAEELAKGTAFENDDDAQKEGCRRTVNTQTAARWTVVEHCDTDTGPSERNVEIIANGARAVTGSMNAVKGEGSAASGLNMTFTGKWVAKDCGAEE
ncbi:MAG TPA: DUF3617 family protein [Pseudomonadales bacterium]|jgi:hypothetical protein|nr:DUF3617 family protein [Pseudomonadales bacterium]